MNNEPLDQFLSADARKSTAPQCESFTQFLLEHARVPVQSGARKGEYDPYTFTGRAPLAWIADLISVILLNTIHGQTVHFEGVTYEPGALKDSTVGIGGGAQWGKSILEQNLMAYLTGVEHASAATYIPDQLILQQIVTSKFRPDVMDQIPWFADLVRVGKAENRSGKSVHRENSFQVTDGDKKAFGHFVSMHKPPTTITLDVAMLDEMDDIKQDNVGFVDGRMTNSPVKLKIIAGTQRIHGAGQNKVVESGTLHRSMFTCGHCGHEQNLEETFPRCARIALDGTPKPTDPMIKAEDGFDRDAHYYPACVECGTEINRDAGTIKAKYPARAKQRRWSIRVSHFACAAIPFTDIVGAYYTALLDPTGAALVAFYCDRVAIPKAGSAQPITPMVIERSIKLGLSAAPADAAYNMALATGTVARFAGMDMGPRCWFWCDEVHSDELSAMVWAEMLSSGQAAERAKLLCALLGVSCLFLDAGGEPEVTKSIVLALNGLEHYEPPQIPQSKLKTSYLSNIGNGCTWDGTRGQWRNIKAAAVQFVARENKGIEQDLGFTVEGKLYPLIKCNRADSIATAVRDFLTPDEAVTELIQAVSGQRSAVRVRTLPRARLPQNFIGTGAKREVVEEHLYNLRKLRDPKTGEEDWADKVENHFGLAKVYARLASTVIGPTIGSQRAEHEPVVAKGSEHIERGGVLL